MPQSFFLYLSAPQSLFPLLPLLRAPIGVVRHISVDKFNLSAMLLRTTLWLRHITGKMK